MRRLVPDALPLPDAARQHVAARPEILARVPVAAPRARGHVRLESRLGERPDLRQDLHHRPARHVAVLIELHALSRDDDLVLADEPGAHELLLAALQRALAAEDVMREHIGRRRAFVRIGRDVEQRRRGLLRALLIQDRPRPQPWRRPIEEEIEALAHRLHGLERCLDRGEQTCERELVSLDLREPPLRDARVDHDVEAVHQSIVTRSTASRCGAGSPAAVHCTRTTMSYVSPSVPPLTSSGTCCAAGSSMKSCSCNVMPSGTSYSTSSMR